MKLTASYHGGTRHDITSGKHRVVTDQPIEDGGQDAGMSPVELFVGSIASPDRISPAKRMIGRRAASLRTHRTRRET